MKIQIGKYYLDEEQTKIVMDNSRYLLVVAGAGSGKTLTILGKIKYLIYEKNIRPEEILCISYTRAAAQSLKDKIKNEFNTDMDVYTFHKLAMRILEENNIKFFGNSLSNFFILDVGLDNLTSPNHINFA